MERFGQASYKPFLKTFSTTNKAGLTHSVNDIWLKIVENNKCSINSAEHWLSKDRGFDSPTEFIGSGFGCLGKEHVALFDHQHQAFIKHRLSLGAQLIVPIRSINSDKVQNLFFRTMANVNKNEKSRLLINCGGWSEKDGSPRAFGFPHLIHDFPKLILCEGMADYFATECLLECGGNFLTIGAANASALNNWATWLSATKFKGAVIILTARKRQF